MHIKNMGIDAVEIERFRHWHLYKKETLFRVFTEQELDYIFAVPEKSAERFATRFAVKEAVFKSISTLISDSFFAAAPYIEVIKLPHGDLACHVHWSQLQCATIDECMHSTVVLSVTHTRTTAIAVVVMQ